MAQFIGVLLAIGAYVALCIFLCTYVLTPAWPFAVVGGAVLGLAVVVVTLAGVLLSAGGYAARTVTPDDVAERLPGIKSPFPRDDAWPNYLFAQSWTDLANALRHTSGAVTAMWPSSASAALAVVHDLVNGDFIAYVASISCR